MHIYLHKDLSVSERVFFHIPAVLHYIPDQIGGLFAAWVNVI